MKSFKKTLTIVAMLVIGSVNARVAVQSSGTTTKSSSRPLSSMPVVQNKTFKQLLIELRNAKTSDLITKSGEPTDRLVQMMYEVTKSNQMDELQKNSFGEAMALLHLIPFMAFDLKEDVLKHFFESLEEKIEALKQAEQKKVELDVVKQQSKPNVKKEIEQYAFDYINKTAKNDNSITNYVLISNDNYDSQTASERLDIMFENVARNFPNADKESMKETLRNVFADLITKRELDNKEKILKDVNSSLNYIIK